MEKFASNHIACDAVDHHFLILLYMDLICNVKDSNNFKRIIVFSELRLIWKLLLLMQFYNISSTCIIQLLHVPKRDKEVSLFLISSWSPSDASAIYDKTIEQFNEIKCVSILYTKIFFKILVNRLSEILTKKKVLCNTNYTALKNEVLSNF